MNISIISNGFGEDQIAAHLVDEIIVAFPHAKVSIFPLVGEGLEYKKRGWIPSLKNPVFPSGGFIRTFSDFFRDCRAGLISHFFKQRAVIKQAVRHSGLTLCVGDVFCLMMGRGGVNGPCVFFPTAKSDLFMPHSWVERKLIARYSDRVFTRDHYTASALCQSGLPAMFLGNPMTDLPEGSTDNLGFLTGDSIIGVLPGSREEAYGNFSKIIEVLPHFQGASYVWAKAETMDIKRVSFENHLNIVCRDEHTWLCNETLSILVWTRFEDLLNQASWFIGLAGTANEQAIYRGKTVFVFEGTGPQSTRQRFEEQRQLLGDQLIIIETDNPSKMAQDIASHSILTRPWNRTSAAKDIVTSIHHDFF